MRNIIFHLNDISIIFSEEIFISASVFDLKKLNKSRKSLEVHGLENYTMQVKQYSISYSYIAIAQENNNTHVIMISKPDLYNKFCEFEKRLYNPQKLNVKAFIEFVNPEKKYSFLKSIIAYSDVCQVKIYIDEDKNFIISKDFRVSGNVKEIKKAGEDFMIHFANSLAYVNNVGIYIRHLSRAELNSTGISFSLGEVRKIIKEVNIEDAQKLYMKLEGDDQLRTAISGINQAYISYSSQQQLIALWSTIETIFNGKSESLFSKPEQQLIVKYIEENIDSQKSEVIKKNLPHLFIETKNELITDNITRLDGSLASKDVKKVIAESSRLRAKCAHKNTSNIDENDVKNCNQKLLEFIRLFINKRITCKKHVKHVSNYDYPVSRSN